MRFEWDARKDRLNQAKHGGIGFEIAIRIGSAMFGLSRSVVLLVTHAYRESTDGEETIRITSARQAGKDDVRRCQEQETD
jgi:uncharacterized DUF497 family protein